MTASMIDHVSDMFCEDERQSILNPRRKGFTAASLSARVNVGDH